MNSGRISLKQFAAFFFALALPGFFFQKWKLHPEAPGARSGDEPHYLVILNSIVRDADLSVENNYNSPFDERGIYLSRYTLDHQTFFVNEKASVRIPWGEIYQASLLPSGGVEIKRRPESLSVDLKKFREIPLHPAGYPMILSVFVAPFIRASFRYYESVIILLQLLLYAFTLSLVQKRTGISSAAVLAVGAALPSWYYAFTIYSEALTAPLYALSLLYFMDRKKIALSFCLGLLIFIKESNLPLLPIFLVFDLLFFRDVKSLRILFFPVLFIMLLILKSIFLYGSPFTTYEPWVWNPRPLYAAAQVFIGEDHGLFVFVPFVFIALFSILFFFYKNPPASIGGIIFLYNYLLITCSIHWSGGPSYGPRLMTPAITLISVAYAMLYREFRLNNVFQKVLNYISIILICISLAQSFSAVTGLQNAYSDKPTLNFFSLMRRTTD